MSDKLNSTYFNESEKQKTAVAFCVWLTVAHSLCDIEEHYIFVAKRLNTF